MSSPRSDRSDRSETIDIIAKRPLTWAPWTTFAYSDVDYLILGLIVEQLSEQRIGH
ncbi:serine hydrolase [Arthrobacter sp. MSA 4-2]|uniref:serine hydrolase n=1 Tax=Arthrobacter sp. MSA 4-2 TaxID=2794349 RepID=UPI0018E8DE5B|nr:serine hydrolase [Arthrobacter sp. MSA 4-2]